MTLRKWILIALIFSTLVGCRDSYSSGDRVLVSKLAYESGLSEPQRYEVVVFKWPGKKPGEGPVQKHTPKNYIKRLLGLPGELLAIFFGRIYRWNPPPNAPPPFDDLKDATVDKREFYRPRFMHINDENSIKRFNAGEFEILRKPPHVLLAMRRIVHDFDFQAEDLKGKGERWKPSGESGWKAAGATGFSHEGNAAADFDWIHYQHLVRTKDHPLNVERKLIVDSMAYNSANHVKHAQHWVGDLMIECNVEVVQPKGDFVLEVSKGHYRYQARWDLATGKCGLKSTDLAGKETDLGSADTNVKSAGNYMLRLANVDARLTVWVDRSLPFGDGKEYDPPEVKGKKENLDEVALIARRGPTEENDIKRPASIGSKGAQVKITHLRVWRDTYYTTASEGGSDYTRDPDSWSDPAQWAPLRSPAVKTMFVQPGHYLCLGDNSQESSDSRDWGTVPERLMLGRALVVYYPLDRIGFIR
jgi:signal peptidase I